MLKKLQIPDGGIVVRRFVPPRHVGVDHLPPDLRGGENLAFCQKPPHNVPDAPVSSGSRGTRVAVFRFEPSRNPIRELFGFDGLPRRLYLRLLLRGRLAWRTSPKLFHLYAAVCLPLPASFWNLIQMVFDSPL